MIERRFFGFRKKPDVDLILKSVNCWVRQASSKTFVVPAIYSTTFAKGVDRRKASRSNGSEHVVPTSTMQSTHQPATTQRSSESRACQQQFASCSTSLVGRRPACLREKGLFVVAQNPRRINATQLPLPPLQLPLHLVHPSPPTRAA